jgi:DNA polymerase V
MTVFGLIDCNNFFVSCERVFRPDLLNKPVGVLSNNDGCFIARSNEVKELGIPMGAPLFKYKNLVDQHDITLFSSNFTLYGDMSSRFMSLIESLVPRLEIYSVDEAFIDFSCIDNVYGLAESIRQQALTCLGLPTCIGISQTKTLAKVANYLAKKKSFYNGVCILESASDIEKALKSIDVKDLWGVGRKMAVRLQHNRIKTGYDLQQADPRWIRQQFTVIGERLVHELNGISCLSLNDAPQPRKSIQISRSFAGYITAFDDLREIVAAYATHLGKKLRKNDLKTAHILVYIRTNPYNNAHSFYQESVTLSLPVAINDDVSLIKACAKALAKIYKPGYLYKKAGVMALDLAPEVNEQRNLFASDGAENTKMDKLSAIMDNINQKYRSEIVHMAACGNKLSWKDRKDKKSPAYTTSWKDLPLVLAN